jgi:uncharacterized protein
VEEFYFLVMEEHCKGFEEDAEWTVETWKRDQGADYYDDINREWKAMMLRRSSVGKPDIDDKTAKLFHMVMYDLDQFRRSSLPAIFSTSSKWTRTPSSSSTTMTWNS